MKSTSAILLPLGLALVLGACYRRMVDQDLVLATRHEARSLLGETLDPPPLAPEREAELTANLDAARSAFEADPGSEDATIWLGRRLAYLGRYRDAIDVFTKGIREHPSSYRLLRHRGHRFITVRRLDDALVDLTRAAELAAGAPDSIEPDGAPNAFGIPTGTDKSNIHYHLGLASYLQGDFEAAAAAYRKCALVSTTDDMLCAATHWLYLTLRRLGRDDDAAAVLAPIHADMEILENHGYYACLRLYQGELSPGEVLDAADGEIDYVSRALGVATWHLVSGEEAPALSLFRRILDEESWMAFGYIAAEAELARRRSASR
jgi:tetratricopeptide (TPR) repeat protein